MSKAKTEILGPVVSDFLKYEATPLTRVAVAADTGTKAGKFVEYPLRGKKLLALTDEADGKVVVQPLNCIIDLSKVADADVKTATTGKTLDALKKEGDAYGIVYQGTPIA
ncbi:oxaloacetate decarboxylase alpha chain [Neisseria sp.]